MSDNNPEPPPPGGTPPESQAPPPSGPYPQWGQQPPSPAPPAWPPPPAQPGADPNYPYQYPYAYAPPVNASLILIFGILSIVLSLFCIIGGVFGPVAWIMGNNALRTLDQAGDPMAQRGTVNAGRICGIIGTILMALMIIFSIVYFAYIWASVMPHGAGP